MLTVLLATHNRCALLGDVLESYTRLEDPQGGWRIVVVNNGSSDETSRILESFRNRLPLTTVNEKRPGKNTALNAGLEKVSGDVVVLTDDDAFPSRNWLVAMRNAADSRPDYSIFSGVVVPRWQSPPPSWILEWVPLAPVFTLTSPSLREGPTEPGHVFGPNMAIRSDVFEQGFRFDPNIGPRGTSYAMGSETELVRRLVRQGHRAWHVRTALVEHFVRNEQLSRKWILGRAVRFGRGRYRLSTSVSTASAACIAGVPRYLLRELLFHAVRILVARLQRNPKAAFEAQWDFSVAKGQAAEAYALSHPAVADSTASSTLLKP